jgi:membrane protease subunit (stomatin/prohibitin family)
MSQCPNCGSALTYPQPAFADKSRRHLKRAVCADCGCLWTAGESIGCYDCGAVGAFAVGNIWLCPHCEENHEQLVDALLAGFPDVDMREDRDQI